MRIGTYRLMRQINGHGAFGEVHLAVHCSQDSAEPQVMWAADGTRGNGYPENVAAAFEGVSLGLSLVESLGVSIHHRVVQITFIGITEVDTEPSAVRAAATAAVVRAFGLEGMCELVHDGEWHYVAR